MPSQYKVHKPFLWLKQRGKCYICGVKMLEQGTEGKSCTIDHVIPLSKGGTNQKKNLKLACRRCNEKKADNGPVKRKERIYESEEV